MSSAMSADRADSLQQRGALFAFEDGMREPEHCRDHEQATSSDAAVPRVARVDSGTRDHHAVDYILESAEQMRRSAVDSGRDEAGGVRVRARFPGMLRKCERY